jgi:hypothetical protein
MTTEQERNPFYILRSLRPEDALDLLLEYVENQDSDLALLDHIAERRSPIPEIQPIGKKTLTLALKDVENEVPRKAAITYSPHDSDRGVGILLPGFTTMTGDADSVVYIEYRGGIPHVLIWADRAQEDPTHTISLEGAAVGPRCPAESRFDGDIEGCGSANISPKDEEGYQDCYDCGVFFKGDYEAETTAIVQRLDLLDGNR